QVFVVIYARRHLNVALATILKLVKSFRASIFSILSSAPPVGVDLEAEHWNFAHPSISFRVILLYIQCNAFVPLVPCC
uniref:Uncharacterized protein n=1 Tax=Aegilops tauschii subsp. strangulata TaxID=200361 RepID=A0A452YEN2_AEGTS